jgi:hypothetical protein
MQGFGGEERYAYSLLKRQVQAEMRMRSCVQDRNGDKTLMKPKLPCVSYYLVHRL